MISRSRSASNETEDDLDTNFAGMILWTDAGVGRIEWILNLGANDHMTCLSNHLFDSKTHKEK